MKTLWIVIAILVVLMLGWWFLSSPTSPTPAPAPTPTPTPTPTAATPSANVTVQMTSSGFSPSEIKIKAGDTVDFVNKDSKSHWPASAVHPAHQCYPGFDALRPVQPGETYSYKFAMAKTCKFHDHLNPGTTGTIAVE